MDQRRCARVAATVLTRFSIPLSLFIVGLAFLLWWTPAQAQDGPSSLSPVLPPDTTCKLCHADTDSHAALASGEALTLTVDLAALAGSVHGANAAQPVYCTDCHSDQQRYLYPHVPTTAQNRSEYRDLVAANCEQCHKSADEHNPGHLQVADQTNTPNCIDCHGGHAVASTEALRQDPIGTCQSCHQSYADPKLQSVHEEVVANLQPGQTCETCHAAAPLSVDAKCQTCHSLLERKLVLPSGDEVSLKVNADTVAHSMHGNRVIDGKTYEALACTECHKDQGHSGYPHAELTVDTQRALTLEMQNVCTDCHEEIAAKQHDSVHAAAIAEGKLEGATCIDCHGNHDIQDPDVPRGRVSQTCGKCHSTINEQYATSVHGAALLGEDNPDVPVCTDCHGVHNIADPTTATFRSDSPEMCGKCHADADKMAKYDISTDVFDTYVADFHGTTVTLFEKQHPDQETNKAVCYDCHGIHNILPASDENSQVIKANLLTTCQKCHPDATTNFPNAWTSHFKPSLQHNTLVYLVDLFYAILIPVTVSGFLIFIGTDVTRRTVNRVRRRKQDRS